MSTIRRYGNRYRIMVDLNTQCDFLLPGGALPVANRMDLLPNIRRLMNWARLQEIPVISSLSSHRCGESILGLPPHCVDHTAGQRKLPFTLLPRRVVIQGDNTLDVPSNPFRRYQQIILTKRKVDLLSNPKADRLINDLRPHHWVIFGVTASQCVKATALGLLARHHRVVLVQDACGYWSVNEGEHAFLQMQAKGAIPVTTDELISGDAEERIMAPQAKKIPDEEWEIFVPRNGNGKARNGDRETTDTAYDGIAGNGRTQKRKPAQKSKDIKDDSGLLPERLIGMKTRSTKTSSRSRRHLA